MPNIPFLCLPPSRVDPKVLGLNVLVYHSARWILADQEVSANQVVVAAWRPPPDWQIPPDSSLDIVITNKHIKFLDNLLSSRHVILHTLYMHVGRHESLCSKDSKLHVYAN